MTQPNTMQIIVALAPSVLRLIGTAATKAGAAGAVPVYLDMLANFFTQTSLVYDDLLRLRDLIRDMVRENREPTEDEWNAIFARSNAAHRAIQDAVVED